MAASAALKGTEYTAKAVKLAGAHTARAAKAVMQQSSRIGKSAARFFGEKAVVESLSSNSAFNGELYSPKKLKQLVKYLERRGVSVYGTEGNPLFKGYSNGSGMMLLPERPTVLQVKHELSHYLDFKKYGFNAFKDMGRAAREESVLNRLQKNRVWDDLNQAEKQFSIDYVNRLNDSKKRFKDG